MKIKFLTVAAVALLLTGGTVLAQQSQPPPNAQPDAGPASAASVCVIGVKMQAGNGALPPGAIQLPPGVQLPPGAIPLPPGAVPLPVAKAPGAPARAVPAQPEAKGKAPDAVAPKLKDLPDEVSESCLNGQIIINVSSRPYGYKIGDVVQVEMEIVLKGGALIDLEPLTQGKITIDDKATNQFEIAGKPFIESGTEDGNKAYDVVVPVRTFVPSPSVVFSMQLPYAEEPKAGTAPQWKTLSTPEYTMLQYVADPKGFKVPVVEGNTGGAVPRIPAALPPLTVIAVILLLTWPTIFMLRYVNRVRTYNGVDRRSAAWLALQRVIRSGKELGFDASHYRRIAEVLRKYLRTEYAGLEGMTLPEIEKLPADSRGDALKRVFRALDRVLVEGKPLTSAEQARLIDEVDTLVSRPFTI